MSQLYWHGGRWQNLSQANLELLPSNASQVIEILVIVDRVPLSQSWLNRPMPGKVEWLCLADPNRIPSHFVASFLRKSGLAPAGNLARHGHYHHVVLTS